MALDDRYLPESNVYLADLLRNHGFKEVPPKETPWGAVFRDDDAFLLIINPETGTTVHDHPNHQPGTITYIGAIERGIMVASGTLAYKCQANKQQLRTQGVDELVLKLSPGDDFNLIYGKGREGVFGRWYGCHNNSKHPVALLLEQINFETD